MTVMPRVGTEPLTPAVASKLVAVKPLQLLVHLRGSAVEQLRLGPTPGLGIRWPVPLTSERCGPVSVPGAPEGPQSLAMLPPRAGL